MNLTSQTVKRQPLKSKGFSKFLIRDSTLVRLTELLQKPVVRGVDSPLVDLMDEVEQLRKELGKNES